MALLERFTTPDDETDEEADEGADGGRQSQTQESHFDLQALMAPSTSVMSSSELRQDSIGQAVTEAASRNTMEAEGMSPCLGVRRHQNDEIRRQLPHGIDGPVSCRCICHTR